MSSQSAIASTEHSEASAGDDPGSEPFESPGKRRARARELLEPALNAGRSVEIWTWTEHEHLYGELRDLIGKQIEAVRSGDMSGLETILVSQTVTLDQIFHSLCRRSGRAGHPEKTAMKLQAALRTQAAIRATIQTLALLKSPPSMNVVAGNQANIGEVNLNRDLKLKLRQPSFWRLLMANGWIRHGGQHRQRRSGIGHRGRNRPDRSRLRARHGLVETAIAAGSVQHFGR
jgi:hypothetical protein